MIRTIICIFMVSWLMWTSAIAQKTEEIQGLKDEIKLLQEKVQALEEAQKSLAKPEKPKKDDKPYFKVFWKEGLRLTTDDKVFSLKIGGRTFLDFGYVHEDSSIQRNLDKIEDYVEFRTARLYTSGTIYGRFIFKSQFDFAATNRVSFKDVYIGMNKLPLGGTLKIGHFKEPFGLENLTSSRFGPFLERGSNVAFTPSRNLGIAYFAHLPSKRFTMAAGVFREAGDSPPRIDDDSGSYALTTRVTGLPWYENKGEKLLHLGVSHSFRNPRNDTVRYRSRPENHVGPRFVDTGNFMGVEYVNLLDLEGSLVFGPFSLQSELIYSWARFEGGNGTPTQHFWGYYVFASFFVTGEHRNYKTTKGAFDRLRPHKNLFDGFGAVEFAVRYSKLNLNDDIRGRRMDNFTAGINWYFNPNMRVMLNYVYSRVSHIVHQNKLEDAHLVIGRLQIDF